MSSLVKAKAPFRYGIKILSAADLHIPVTEKPASEEAQVNIPETENPSIVPEEIPEAIPTKPEVEAVLLENAGFSAASVRNLNANDIETVEQLEVYLQTGATLEALEKIGVKSAKTITEELDSWKVKTSVQNSQE